MRLPLYFSNRIAVLTLAILLSVGATGSVAHAQVPVPSTDAVLFDNISDPVTGDRLPLSSFKFIDATPRTLIGAKINLGNAPDTNLIRAKQIELGLAHLPTAPGAVTYTNIQLQMKFYDSGSAEPETDVFTDAITDVLSFNVFDAIKAASPAQTANNQLLRNQGYFFRVDLPTSLVFKDRFNIGIAFRFRGDKGDGNGLRVSEDLSLVMRQGAPFRVGSSDFFSPSLGYLRDGAGGTQRGDFNFDQTDGATLVSSPGNPYPNVGVAMRLYGTVIPEASTGYLLAVTGLAASITAVVRRRKIAA